MRPFYKTMLAIGMPIDIVEVGAIIWWIATGDWRPFAVVMPLVVIICVFVVRAYRAHTAYVCPLCREVFVPKVAEWLFAAHTPTTRKVTCARCGTKEWGAEASSERLVR